MKLWKKITGGILLVLVGAGGYLYYTFEMKDYNVAPDQEVEQITESEYSVDIPDLESLTVAEAIGTNEASDGESEGTDGKSNTASSGTTSGTEQSETASSKQASSPESSTSTNKVTTSQKETAASTTPKKEQKPKITVEMIKGAYRGAFENLQSQANGKIDALVNRAIGEYYAKQAAGEEISFGYFYSKYSSAGSALEARTDATFQSLMAGLKRDLKKYGYSTTHADEFQQAYESAKASRRNALLNMAMGQL